MLAFSSSRKLGWTATVSAKISFLHRLPCIGHVWRMFSRRLRPDLVGFRPAGAQEGWTDRTFLVGDKLSTYPGGLKGFHCIDWL